MEGVQDPMEEQINLAKALCEANDERNQLTSNYPDLSDLSVFVNASPENREAYESAERKANEARAKFDKVVMDKKALVEHLRTLGKDELADRITRMFDVR